MARRRFTILSAVLLLLCVAVWLVSYAASMSVQAVTHTSYPTESYKRAWNAQVARGSLVVFVQGSDHFYTDRWPATAPFAPPGWSVKLTRYDQFSYPSGLRVPGGLTDLADRNGPLWGHFGQGGGTNASWGYGVRIPCWAAALAAGVLPALALKRMWQERRARAIGLCRICGYDLRATPDRCPECGTVPKKIPSAN